MTGYAVVVEGDEAGYSAYGPDLAGCVAAGATVNEVETWIGEAIELHVESLRAHRDPVPSPSAVATTVVVA